MRAFLRRLAPLASVAVVVSLLGPSRGAAQLRPSLPQATPPLPYAAQVPLVTGVAAPTAVAVDAAGEVYVVDRGHGRVIKITKTGATQTVATTGMPTGVAVNESGDLVVVSQGPASVVLTAASPPAKSPQSSKVATIPAPAPAPTTIPFPGLRSPAAVAVAGDQTVYVLDTAAHQVLMAPPGGSPKTLSIPGLLAPAAIAVSPAGDVIIADPGSHRVVERTAGGSTQTLPFRGLSQPEGVAVDAAGDVFVADAASGQVLELAPAGEAASTVPITGLWQPGGLAVDGAGNLYVADTAGNRVVEVLAAASGPARTFPSGATASPSGIAVDKGGDVFVADAGTDQVLELPAKGSPTVLPFQGLSGPEGVAVDTVGNVFVADTANDRIVELAHGAASQTVLPLHGLNHPHGVAVDIFGDVFVADTGNNRILDFTSAHLQLALAMPLNQPQGLAVDPIGDVYAADSADGRVVVRATQGAIAVLPLPNLVFPTSIAIDGAGDLFIADPYAGRIVELPVGGVATTAPLDALARPGALAVDAAGDLYVADAQSNEAVKVPVDEATFTYPTNGLVGVDVHQPFQWTGVPSASAYDMVIGTSPQGAQLFNSGVLPASQTSIQVPALPFGEALYATLLTQKGGRFTSFEGIEFSVAPVGASFTYPHNGDNGVDTTKPFSWTDVLGVKGYTLTIGTTPGADDVLDSRILPATQSSLDTGALPPGVPLYAALRTEANGVFGPPQSIVFTAAPGEATFSYPFNGQAGVSPSHPLTWTTIPEAQGYLLTIGTTVYGTNLLKSAPLPPAQSSYPPPALRPLTTYYATLLTEVNGKYSRSTTIGFTTG
ncbi:MAG: hypothetical protein ACRDZ8_06760 [Acidimicrobiales bacterium]